MSIISVILLIVIFVLIQFSFFHKAHKKWVKLIPSILTAIGLLVGLVIYIWSYISYKLNISSKSVMSENQYFVFTIWVPLIVCFIGCLIGLLLTRFKSKRKLLFLIPAILSIIIFLICIILGFGIPSINQFSWLILFFIAGILLCKNRFWGSLFGLIPGFIFMYMSTQETGQVINIELPLGIGICLYYIICGLIVFKKNKIK